MKTDATKDKIIIQEAEVKRNKWCNTLTQLKNSVSFKHEILSCSQNIDRKP